MYPVRLSSLWFLFAVLMVAMAFLGINLSAIHRAENAASLIPVLVSVDHWTPFYWGQTRFGMLAPFCLRGCGTRSSIPWPRRN